MGIGSDAIYINLVELLFVALHILLDFALIFLPIFTLIQRNFGGQ